MDGASSKASQNKEFAAAVKDFAEAEQKKVESELQRRSLESKVRQEEAKALLDELKVIDAEIELLKKLKDIGVVLSRDSSGSLTVLPSQHCDLEQLARQKRLGEQAGGTESEGKNIRPPDAALFSKPSRERNFLAYLRWIRSFSNAVPIVSL